MLLYDFLKICKNLSFKVSWDGYQLQYWSWITANVANMVRKSEFEYASYDDFMLPDVDSAECQANLMIYSWDKKKHSQRCTHMRRVSQIKLRKNYLHKKDFTCFSLFFLQDLFLAVYSMLLSVQLINLLIFRSTLSYSWLSSKH